MRIERRPLGSLLLGALVWGITAPIIAQEREAPAPETSESIHVVARLGSMRFDIGSLLGSVAWSPDGKFLATIVERNRTAVWNSQTGERVWLKDTAFRQTPSLHFSSDGKFLIRALKFALPIRRSSHARPMAE